MNFFVHKIPPLLKQIYPDALWNMPRKEKTIYLTFDDGPIDEITENVLEILDTYQAKATFFCIGNNIEKNPIVFNKIKEKSHSIGNHTQHHLNGWKNDNTSYFENIDLCKKTLQKHLTETSLFRPPYGRISKIQYENIKKMNQIVLWDVLSGDFSPDISPEKCLKKTIQYSQNGSIIVFHDSIKASKNMLYALPRFLEHFSEKSYQFLALKATKN